MIGRRFWVLLLVLWAIWGLAVVVTLRAVHAHDPAHPEHNPWFDHLKSKGGQLCCSGDDGTALSDVDWETKDGHYRVRIDGEWLDVPKEAVVEEANRVGKTMVWPFRVNGRINIRCFMPGAMI